MPDAERPSSLAEALTLLQTRLPRITKATQGQRSKYADLHDLTDAITPVLAELGLFWVCRPMMADGEFVLRYRLTHVSSTDDYYEGDYPLNRNTDPQRMGSEITYARRYALTAVLNIAPAGDDDDGQAAADASRGGDWQAPANPRSRKATRQRNTASETTDWNAGEGPLAPEHTPGSILPGQLQGIGILMTKVGAGRREDRLALTVKLLNLPGLDSSKDLSMAQGTELINLLQAEADKT
jgi:hypothetical protein